MVEDKILYIARDGEFLFFDGNSFSPFEAKKAKNYYSGLLINSTLLRPHGFKAPENISAEKLEIQAEMSMYEEAGLDPETDFKIASVRVDLENESNIFVESYAVENSVLMEKFSPIASKLKQIDYIVPSFLRYKALYAYEKLEAKNDVFIYFGEDEAYAVMYKDSKYISTRSIITLNELSKKMEIDLSTLKNMLSSKGVKDELYAPDEFLKMHSIQEELSKIVERVSHSISHKRGIFGLDRIDRFFIDFDGSDIPGFLELFKTYGFDNSEFLLLNVFDEIEPERYSDGLGALYILGIVEGKYTTANLSVFERQESFYKTHAGIFMIVLGVSTLFALAYPVYGSYRLAELEAQKDELQVRVNAMNTLTKKLQKKLKEVRVERKNLENVKKGNIDTIKSYDTLVDTLKQQKLQKKKRQKMMKDVNQVMAYYKLSSRNLEQNASDLMHVHLISEYNKRDNIAKFMKDLLNMGYLHVSTLEIRREKNLYESVIEIRP